MSTLHVLFYKHTMQIWWLSFRMFPTDSTTYNRQKFNFNFVFTFGMYFITPATKKKKKYKEFFRISYQLVSSKRVQNGILMWSLQIYIQIYLIYALSAGVCVCVCVYIHKIHWLFYSLFIQLTCIKCSLLTDRCEDKNHLPMRSIQVTEKMVMYPKGKEDQTS